MSGETRRKVYKRELIKSLIDNIREIDSDESIPQFVRTKLYRREATKVRKRLFEDGRVAERNKLSILSYRRYLSDVKKAAREQNWKHHGLPKEVDKLARTYPQFKKQLLSLLSVNSEEMRREHTKLLALVTQKRKDTKKTIYREAYNDFKAMKLDHDVLRFLAMDETDKDDLRDIDKDALEAKKTSTVDINYYWVESTINRLLKESMYSYAAIGLALASGRRAVEILYQGRFTAKGEYTVTFSGHAKKRGGADHKTKSEIYTLIPAKDFCAAMKRFREMKPVAALKQYDEIPETQRNVEINRRTAKTLNESTKRAFDNNERMFKETRAIWARIVYEKYFQADERWKSVDEDIFWREMLGHQEDDTQEHYKYIKIDYTEPEQEEQPLYTNTDGENIRIKRLMRLGKDYRVANRKALVKINDFVMQRINDNPEATFNQSMISREIGANRQAIKDYIALVDEHYKGLLSKPTKAKKPEPESKPEPETKQADSKTETAPAKEKTTQTRKRRSTAKKPATAATKPKTTRKTRATGKTGTVKK